MISCPVCSTTLAEEKNFCPACGAPLRTGPSPMAMPVCNHCGAQIPSEKKFCIECGRPVAPQQAVSVQPPAKPEGVPSPVRSQPRAVPARSAPPACAAPLAQPLEARGEGRRWGLMIGAAVIVLGLAGGGWYYLTREGQPAAALAEKPRVPAPAVEIPESARSFPSELSLAPVLLGPGRVSEPGDVISGTTPMMFWEVVPGATTYGINILVEPCGSEHLVYENESISGDSSSLVVPPGVLVRGRKYCWSMRAKTRSGWGPFSSRFYFQVAGVGESEFYPETPRAEQGLRVRELLQSAEREFERGQYRNALSYCEQALRLDPGHSEARALRDKIQRTMEILGIR